MCTVVVNTNDVPLWGAFILITVILGGRMFTSKFFEINYLHRRFVQIQTPMQRRRFSQVQRRRAPAQNQSACASAHRRF